MCGALMVNGNGVGSNCYLPQSAKHTGLFRHVAVHLSPGQAKVAHHGREIVSEQDVVRSHVSVHNAADATLLVQVAKGSGGAKGNLLPVLPRQTLPVLCCTMRDNNERSSGSFMQE